MVTEPRATNCSLHTRGSHKQGKRLLLLWTSHFTAGKGSCLERSLLQLVKRELPEEVTLEWRGEGEEGSSYVNL